MEYFKNFLVFGPLSHLTILEQSIENQIYNLAKTKNNIIDTCFKRVFFIHAQFSLNKNPIILILLLHIFTNQILANSLCQDFNTPPSGYEVLNWNN